MMLIPKPFRVLFFIALWCSLASANSLLVDFEGFSDSTQLTDQYAGLSFQNATVITAGDSLNELEFPPNSGANVVFDDGGPITIRVELPADSFSGYFTHTQPLTLAAFDAAGNLLSSVASTSSDNLGISGDPNTAPNELIQLFDPAIASVTITGASTGGSFTVDDLTIDQSAVATPEPATIWLALSGVALIVFVPLKTRCHVRHLLYALPLLASSRLGAAPIGPIQTQPGSIVAGAPAAVTVTALITDTRVLAGGVNLLRVDQAGKAAGILAALHDDGKNGDVVAGDGTFTAQVSFNEASAGTVYLELSVALKGVLQRSLSAIYALPVRPQIALPPSPSTVAPPLSSAAITPLGQATQFLYQGPNPIQSGVDVTKMVSAQAGVLRGRVLDRSGSPQPAVQVSIHNHPEFGHTLSRADGWFDMAVNAGGVLVVDYSGTGLIPLQRRIATQWAHWMMLPDVVLMAPNANATQIDLTANLPFQVARGSVGRDADGTRQSTLLFPQGAVAVLQMPDGSTQPLNKFNLRISEYTVDRYGPASMPGDLPPSSQYTYSNNFTVDEAVSTGATSVQFTKPVINYVDNFLNWKIGSLVPLGYYDRQRAVWAGAPDGRVVKVLANVAGFAVLDVDGTGNAATVAERDSLGITVDELQQVALLYSPGQSVWRAQLTHFSDTDLNGPLPEAPKPTQTPSNKVTPKNPPVLCPNLTKGSIIDCNNQILGETVPITGTPWMLHYGSDRVPGRRVSENTLTIPVTPSVQPPALSEVVVDVAVAGQFHEFCFGPAANQQTTFTWDGLDAYGRPVVGGQPISVSITYLYPLIAQSVSASGGGGGGGGFSGEIVPTQSWAEFSQNPNATIGSGRSYGPQTSCSPALVLAGQLSGVQTSAVWNGIVGGGDARAQSIGGWSLSAHHFYDPTSQVLLLGDGTRLDSSAVDLKNRIIQLPGGFANVTGNAIINLLAANADGSYYAGNAFEVWKVKTDGTISPVIGDGFEGTAATYGDNGPALNARLGRLTGMAEGPKGELYLAEEDNPRIRVIGLDGIVRPFAGTGVEGYSGDHGQAVNAKLSHLINNIAVAADGTVYVADQANYTVRKISTDGIITSIPGTGTPANVSPNYAVPTSVAVLPTGELVFGLHGATVASPQQICEVTRAGEIVVLAGTGSLGFSGDGGPAIQAQIGIPTSMATGPDGSIYFYDSNAYAIRQITPDGTILRIAGTTLSYDTGLLLYGPALQTSFSDIESLAFTADGGILIGAPGYNPLKLVSAFASVAVGETIVGSGDGSEVYVFNISGQHVRTLDVWTGSTKLTFGYDAQQRLISVKDAFNNITQIQRDNSGSPTAVVGPYGQTTTISVDATGMISQVSNPAGESFRFLYTNGLMNQSTDPRGNRHLFSYEADGRLKVDADPAGGSKTLLKSGPDNNFSVAVTTAMGRKQTYSTNLVSSFEQDLAVTDSAGFTTTWQRLGSGQTNYSFPDGSSETVTRIGDPRWGMASPVPGPQTYTFPSGLTYNFTSRTSASLADPSNPFSLTSWEQLTTINGQSFDNLYDGPTRTFRLKTPEGRQLSKTLDALGRVSSVQVGNLFPVSYQYDTNGRVSTISQGAGPIARNVALAYDRSGRVSQVTDPLGRNVMLTYDAADRVLTESLPGGRQILLSYDMGGNLKSLTPPGKTAHTFTYDGVDDETAYVAPAVPNGGTNTTSTTYNPDHQITRLVHADSQNLTTTYDVAGRPGELKSPTTDLNLSYAKATGNLSSVTSSTGVNLAINYDGSLPLGQTWTGLVTGSVQKVLNPDLRVTSISVNGANTIAFGYDRDGLVTNAGDMTITRDSNTGLTKSTSLGSVSEAYQYDGFGETISHTVSTGSAVLFSQTFVRDNLGKISQKTEVVDGATSIYIYSYDAAGRLSTVMKNDAMVEEYEYDLNGNRTRLMGSAAGTYDAQDRLLTYKSSSYAYTANGDLQTKTASDGATQYTYDFSGNLRSVVLPGGNKIEYLVDPANRRVGKSLNGVLQTKWLYEDGLRPIAELDGDGNLANLFVYGNGSNVPAYMVRGGIEYKVITDQIGSIRLVVQASTGMVFQEIKYDSFGNVLTDSNPGFQPFGFAGGFYDGATGLVRFGARDYDAVAGRWATKDPVGLRSGTNLYAYVHADPVNRIDRFGRQDSCPADGGVPEPADGGGPVPPDQTPFPQIGAPRTISPADPTIRFGSDAFNQAFGNDPRIQFGQEKLEKTELGNPIFDPESEQSPDAGDDDSHLSPQIPKDPSS